MVDSEVYERGIRVAVELKSDNNDMLHGLVAPSRSKSMARSRAGRRLATLLSLAVKSPRLAK